MKAEGTNGKRRLTFLGKAVLSTLLLGWLIWRADLGEVGRVVSQARWPILIGAFFFFFFGYFLTASRWRVLLEALQIELGLVYLMQSFAVGVFFNNFLPSTVGGDVVRVYDTWRAGGGRVNALAAVFLDRLIGVSALALFAAGGLLVSGGFEKEAGFVAPAVWSFLGITAAAVLLVFFLPPALSELLDAVTGRLPGVLGHLGRRFLDAAALVRGRADILAAGLGYSILLQGNVIVFYFLVGYALDLPLGLPDYALIVPLALIVMLIPVSVNGVGLREGVFAFFFGFYGIGLAEALAFSWLIYGQILLQGLVGGIVYLVRKHPVPGPGGPEGEDAAQ